MGHDEGWAGQGVGRRPQQVGVGCLDFAALVLVISRRNILGQDILIDSIGVGQSHVHCPGTNMLVP